MSDELSKYLDALSAEGQAHSRGEFTVDFRRARELLQGALYENPSTYLIKFIQAAVRSRTHEIRMRIECHAVSIAFRPHTAPFALDIVEKALNAPLETDRDGFLRDVALGLQAACGLEPSMLLWGNRDISGGEAIVLTPDGRTRRVPLPAGSETECVFQMRRSQVRWVDKIIGRSKNSADEIHYVTQMCQYCPVPIYLGEALLNRPDLPNIARPASLLSFGSSYNVLVERLILSRDPLHTLLLAPPAVERQAYYYDLGYGSQDLGLSHKHALYQWGSFQDTHHHINGSPLFRPLSKLSFKAVGEKFIDRIFSNHPHAIPLGHPMKDPNADPPRPAVYHVPDLSGYTVPPFKLSYHLLGQSQPLAGHAYFVAAPEPVSNQSWLWPVQYGAILKPYPIETAIPGMLMIVADNALKTDLSGLQVLQDERLEAMLKWLRIESETMKKGARTAIRFGDKLGMQSAQLKYVRHVLQIEDIEY